MKFTLEQIEWFFDKLIIRPDDQCWGWRGRRSPQGYGRWSVGGKDYQAHRITYFLFIGEPGDGTYMCHRCDNPPCCNPFHLFEGTAADNHADMMQKGRQAKGDRHGSRTHPERVPRGPNHPSRLHPERVARGPEKNTARGEQAGLAKLTDAKVREIRQKLRDGYRNQTAVAKEYGVSRKLIALVRDGKIWTHVKDSDD